MILSKFSETISEINLKFIPIQIDIRISSNFSKTQIQKTKIQSENE
jgi:hypothetical protein